MTDAINSHSRRMYNAQKNTRADLEATASPSIATPLDDPRVKALQDKAQAVVDRWGVDREKDRERDGSFRSFIG